MQLLLCLAFLIDASHHSVISIELFGMEDLARSLGVSVTLGALPAGWWGAFRYTSRTVTMRAGLSVAQFRSVLAHELGHAHLGHTRNHPPHSKQESAADRFAAKHLVRMDDYHAAMAMHGLDTDAMARELHVMPWVIRDYASSMSGSLYSRVGMPAPVVEGKQTLNPRLQRVTLDS